MIEVLRQTLGELANSLALLGFIMPETVMTQLDNCYENKNQFVFAFFRLWSKLGRLKLLNCIFLSSDIHIAQSISTFLSSRR